MTRSACRASRSASTTTASCSPPRAAWAVKRARAQAGQLADAAEVSLGQVVSIDEGNVVVPFESRSAADVAASGVPIEPGTQTVSIQVTVVSRIA